MPRKKITSVSTIAAAAREVGVSERTLHTWLHEGCPGQDPRSGHYSPAAIKAWREEHKQPDRKRSIDDREEHSGLLGRKLLAETRRAEEDARARKLKNDIADGNLWPKDIVLEQLKAEYSHIKALMEPWPDEIEMMFPAKQRAALKAELQRKIELLLTRLSTFELDLDEAPEDPDEDDE